MHTGKLLICLIETPPKVSPPALQVNVHLVEVPLLPELMNTALLDGWPLDFVQPIVKGMRDAEFMNTTLDSLSISVRRATTRLISRRLITTLLYKDLVERCNNPALEPLFIAEQQTAFLPAM